MSDIVFNIYFVFNLHKKKKKENTLWVNEKNRKKIEVVHKNQLEFSTVWIYFSRAEKKRKKKKNEKMKK